MVKNKTLKINKETSSTVMAINKSRKRTFNDMQEEDGEVLPTPSGKRQKLNPWNVLQTPQQTVQKELQIQNNIEQIKQKEESSVSEEENEEQLDESAPSLQQSIEHNQERQAPYHSDDDTSLDGITPNEGVGSKRDVEPCHNAPCSPQHLTPIAYIQTNTDPNGKYDHIHQRNGPILTNRKTLSREVKYKKHKSNPDKMTITQIREEYPPRLSQFEYQALKNQIKSESHSVASWLQYTVGLPQYTQSFISFGYNSMQAIQSIQNKKLFLAKLGITHAGDKARILAEIRTLQRTAGVKVIDKEHSFSDDLLDMCIYLPCRILLRLLCLGTLIASWAIVGIALRKILRAGCAEYLLWVVDPENKLKRSEHDGTFSFFDRIVFQGIDSIATSIYWKQCEFAINDNKVFFVGALILFVLLHFLICCQCCAKRKK
eukprot:754067_1